MLYKIPMTAVLMFLMIGLSMGQEKKSVTQADIQAMKSELDSLRVQLDSLRSRLVTATSADADELDRLEERAQVLVGARQGHRRAELRDLVGQDLARIADGLHVDVVLLSDLADLALEVDQPLLLLLRFLSILLARVRGIDPRPSPGGPDACIDPWQPASAHRGPPW